MIEHLGLLEFTIKINNLYFRQAIQQGSFQQKNLVQSTRSYGTSKAPFSSGKCKQYLEK